MQLLRHSLAPREKVMLFSKGVACGYGHKLKDGNCKISTSGGNLDLEQVLGA